MEIRLQVGSVEKCYVFVETNAPEEYDYGYVIPVFETTDEREGLKRYVLVPRQNLKYQTGRYQSGMHYVETDDDMLPLQHAVEEVLLKRLKTMERE